MAVSMYKIHVFNEGFFLLTIRMPIATKLFRVVTSCEELSPINMHDTSVESRDKLNTYIRLQIY